MYKCLECEYEFNDHNLYCEDWRNEDLKLGCPNCKTFYRLKPERTHWPSSLKILIITFSMLGLFHTIVQSDVKSALYFGTVFLASTVLFYKYLPLIETYRPIVKVASHNKSIQPTAKASAD
ncbi:MAG: DNA-directed RNA polymerase subunit RPC12/RpoP [Porticoccaceae bacterium]|jgi:DNA-directed RNA polymerase subunit RPC12/RpoP